MESGQLTKKDCPTCGRSYEGNVQVCPEDGSVLSVQDPLVGTTLADRYKILSVLGRGGMSVVYKARHQLMDRQVAIKMLHAQLLSDPQSINRFQLEARAVSQLSHPHIIMVYDFGITDKGLPYLVMDYLEGLSLSDVIKENGSISLGRGMKVFSEACDALQHAHSKGVIHRDLKPSNIMLITHDSESDYVKIVDFGIAKLLTPEGHDVQRLTQTGEVVGSPLYMSPEQLMGHKLDARSDIYSMGCVMYESLTGKPPFLGDNVIDTMRKHLDEAPAPLNAVRKDLSVSQHLEDIIFRALEKEASKRYQTMKEMKEDLDTASSEVKLKSTPHTVQFPKKGAEPAPKTGTFTIRIPEQLEKSPRFLMILTGGLTTIGLVTLWAVLAPYGPVQVSLAQQHWQEYDQAVQNLVQHNQIDEALKMDMLALKEAEKLGDKDPRMATSLENLGFLYRVKEDYHNSEKTFKKLLDINSQHYGINDAHVAGVLDHLASLYNKQRRFSESEDVLNRSLKIKKSKLGMNDMETSRTLDLMAQLYDDQAQYDKAEPLYKQVIAIREKVLPPADPETTDVLYKLALLYDHEGKYDEAEKLYKRVEDIYTQTLGPEDPSLADVMESHSDLLRRTNRSDEADKMAARVWQIYHKQGLR